jgi:hypothetical protein
MVDRSRGLDVILQTTRKRRGGGPAFAFMRTGALKPRGEPGGGGGREVLLTKKNLLTVGKRNALSGNTASGRTGFSI